MPTERLLPPCTKPAESGLQLDSNRLLFTIARVIGQHGNPRLYTHGQTR
jgi:hypothetical protein